MNSAVWLVDGKVALQQSKMLLPTYDVFDEMRNFAPAKRQAVFPFCGKKMALTICEDAWNDKRFWNKRLYTADPVELLMQAGGNFLLNISASPFWIGKRELRREMLATIARNYKGLFALAPGVPDNGRLAPNAGGSRMDNLYLVDGINVTNPDFGDIYPNDLTELDIKEVSIVRGGITAEFGRAGGMVVNAITKSGTNELHGEVRGEYQPSSFVAANKDPNVKNTPDTNFIGLALGGPIVHDRLWFYGSASRPSTTLTDRVNNLGAIPDQTLTTEEYFGKLTLNPSSNHFINASLRSRDTSFDGFNINSTSAPSVGTNDAKKYLLGTVSWTWNLTADSFVEAKYNHDKEENSTDPFTNLGYKPAFNATRPDLVGQFTTTPDFIIGGATAVGQSVGGAVLAINNQDYTRDEGRATYQTFKTWGNSRHDLRTGLTYEDSSERLERRANGWGSVTWNATTRQFTALYTSQQPPHTGRGTSYGAFLQDQISFNERLTLTLGVLDNKDEYFGEVNGTPGTKQKKKILTFDWGQEIQPRLGIAYVPRPELGDKVYFNFGRYYNTENKSLGRAASPTRIFTTRAIFDAAGNMISDTPAANTQSKTIDKGLDPRSVQYIHGLAVRTLLNSGFLVEKVSFAFVRELCVRRFRVESGRVFA